MTTRSNYRRHSSTFRLLGSVGCLVLASCSAPAGDELDAAGAEAAPGEQKSAINVVNSLCSIANDIPSFDIGAFHIQDPTCHANTRDSFYYFGSGGPGNYAQTLSDATYCSVANATGSGFTGNATFSTPVGRFGAQSVLRSFSRDNQARHIEAEHTGTAVLFGVEVPLQYSTTAWDFPTEHQSSRYLPAQHQTAGVLRNPDGSYRAGLSSFSDYSQLVPDQTGYYAKWHNQNLDDWSIGGSGIIPITPALPLHITVQLNSGEALNNFDNGRFDSGVATNPTYSTLLSNQAVCLANCRNSSQWWCPLSCPSLTSSQVTGHELKCSGGCNSNYWHNLGDGVLPYSGNAGGSSGNLLYQDPTYNYWQVGFPGTQGNPGIAASPNTPGAAPEVQYGLLSGSPRSTNFAMTTEADYDAGIASLKFGVKLDYLTRVGASLRTRTLASDINHPVRGDTEMRADAETAINLNAFLNIHVDLTFTSLDFGFDYDLIDKSGSGHKSGMGSGGGYTWVDNHTGTNDAGTASCTAYATPDTYGPRLPNVDGWGAVNQIARASVDQLHPCNVQICVPSFVGSNTGTFTYYDWVSGSDTLSARPSTNSCQICDSSAAMCNAQGAVVQVSKTDTPTACGGVGDICAGAQYCDSSDDCGGGTCVGSCCSAPPR
jgi:hypothetical protein